MKKIMAVILLALLLCMVVCACDDDIPDPSKKDTIIAGVRGDAPGFGYIAVGEQEPQGFEVDLVKAIAEHMGKDVEFRIMSNTNREKSLTEGEVDMVAAIYTITEDRKERMTFSQSYFTDYLVFMAKEADGFQSITDLQGARIASAVTTTPAQELEAVLEQQGVEAEAVLFDTFENAVAAYHEGKIDALFMDESVMRGYMDDGSVILEDKYSPQDYGIATRLEDVQFSREIDNILTEMKESSELAAIWMRWT